MGVAVAPTYTGILANTRPQSATVWNYAATMPANNWSDIHYANGMFVAVASSGSNRVATSTDGITWTAHVSAGETSAWQKVSYANGLWVAVADGGTVRCMTSTNGVDWTPQTLPAYSWKGVQYGGDRWIAVNSNGGAANQIYSSLDGVTWGAVSTPVGASLGSVAYGNSLWIALGLNSDTYLKSANGITWTSHTTPYTGVTYFSLTFSGTHFCSCQYNVATNGCIRTTDGTTWVSSNLPGAQTNRRLASGPQGLIYSAHGNVSGSNAPYVSRDHGATWELNDTTPVNPGPNTYGSVAIGAGRIVLGASAGANANRYGAYSNAP